MPPRIVQTAGSYDQRVTIQQLNPAPTRDDAGAVDRTDDNNWQTYAARWASIKAISGTEINEADQTAARATHEVRLRSDSETRTITRQMRIIHGSRTLNIEHVSDLDAAKREMYLLCTEAAS